MTSNCGKNKHVTHGAIAECVTDVLFHVTYPVFFLLVLGFNPYFALREGKSGTGLQLEHASKTRISVF